MSDPNDDVSYAVMRLHWRLDVLEQWRADIEKRVLRNTRELERLVKADEIADEITRRMTASRVQMSAREALGLTRMQAWTAVAGVVVGFLTVLASVVVQFVH